MSLRNGLRRPSVFLFPAAALPPSDQNRLDPKRVDTENSAEQTETGPKIVPGGCCRVPTHAGRPLSKICCRGGWQCLDARDEGGPGVLRRSSS